MDRSQEFLQALEAGNMDALRHFFYTSNGREEESRLRALLDKEVPRLARLHRLEAAPSFIRLVAQFEMLRFMELIEEQNWEAIFRIMNQQTAIYLSLSLHEALEISTRNARISGICFAAILHPLIRQRSYPELDIALNCTAPDYYIKSWKDKVRIKVKVEHDDFVYRPNVVFLSALAAEINHRGFIRSALNALYLLEKVFAPGFWFFLNLLDDVYIAEWLSLNKNPTTVAQMRAMIRYCYCAH